LFLFIFYEIVQPRTLTHGNRNILITIFSR
jgi:hypothetical protein